MKNLKTHERTRFKELFYKITDDQHSSSGIVIVNSISMEHIIHDLRQVINDYATKISNIADSELSIKQSPNKWSKKEVFGHLIDSAHSNLRRFVCAQYETVPPKIVYDQDFWVLENGYNRMNKEDVITLWKLINERIICVLTNMPSENYKRKCDTSKQEPELRELEWLAEDYVKHMKHHLNQIIPGSFDIKYS